MRNAQQSSGEKAGTKRTRRRDQRSRNIVPNRPARLAERDGKMRVFPAIRADLSLPATGSGRCAAGGFHGASSGQGRSARGLAAIG
jgi:hypothetical protein